MSGATQASAQNPYYSGEFHPPHAGDQMNPGGLAVFGSTLFYIRNGDDETLNITLADLSQLSQIKDDEAWTTYQPSSDQIGFQPATNTKAAAAVVSCKKDNEPAQRLYCFWADSDSKRQGQVFAIATDDSRFSTDAAWSPNITLYTRWPVHGAECHRLWRQHHSLVAGQNR
jgi:hypothetical protein